MTGVKGRSGVASRPEHFEARAEAGRKSGVARRARQADKMAAIITAMRERGDLDPEVTDEEAMEALDVAGNVIPKPSPRLEDYAEGEKERQLAWGRYIQGCSRAVELATKKRERIPVEEVGEWCERVMAIINRDLPSLLALAEAMPNISEENRAWLREQMATWERGYRERLVAEKIE